MFFIVLLALAVLSIAGSAAFFSVYGLAKVFSGLFLPVVIMGGALEFGKLISVSFLYRYWQHTGKLLRTGLFVASLGLMAITSMGIFGFLSAAYQSDVLPYQAENQQVQLLENEKTEAETLKTERLKRQEEINKQIANLPDNSVNGRRKLMAANKDELEQINKDIAQYTSDIRQHTLDISKIKGQTLQETVHVGPIIFLAKALGMDVDTAVKWLIILIIIVFDPLAVMLTIAMNIALAKQKEVPVQTPETLFGGQELKGEPISDELTVENLAAKEVQDDIDAYMNEPPMVDIDAFLRDETPTATNATFTAPITAPQEKPRITAPDGWYSTDGGMSFKHPAPHASAPTVGNGYYGTSTLNLGSNNLVAGPGIWGGAAPAPGPFTVHTIGEPIPPTSEEPHLEDVASDDPEVQKDLSVFEKALEQFNKSDLTDREKSAKHALEYSIKRYLDLLNPKK